MKNLMERLGVGEDDVIENRFVSRALEQAQAKIEGFNFDARKYVLEYDDVMNRHRTAIYELRNRILASSSSKDLIFEYFDWLVGRLVEMHTKSETGEWNTEEIAESIKTMTVSGQNLHGNFLEFSKTQDVGGLKKFITDFISEEYSKKEKELGEESMGRLEGLVLLRVIDELWVDHLEAMEYLRESVKLRAYGQRDPLAEYKVEGQRMFEELLNNVKVQVANLIFKVSFTEKPKSVEMYEGRDNLVSDKKEEKTEPVVSDKSQVGRNDPCPCGSKKKYKRCHGK
ncbi:MAG: SEC-C domain-containing protein [Candidatus Yanofskybacteria bacterium]|nr:SEC-C domain-containing protein [Candidatus Yanofskybacteria bacterium]